MSDPSDVVEPLALPDAGDWNRIGVRLGPELHAGHQSRVFRAGLNDRAVVVKLTDRRLVDEAHRSRIDVCRRVAEVNPSVVGPVPIGDSVVTELDDWLVVAYPFVDGVAPDLDRREDVTTMGASLAALHESLATLDATDLPPVAALRAGGGASDSAEFGERQLLHGDFSDANTLLAGGDVGIFDFDDCGYGPIEFEVGTSVYMVLFDAAMTGDTARYERFRDWFVTAYEASKATSLTEATLDDAIRLRIDALGHWLDDLRRAPIGIRTASPEWHRTLRTFVDTH